VSRLRSIRARFTAWYLLVLAVLLVLLGVGSYFSVRAVLHRDIDRGLLRRFDQLAGIPDLRQILSEGRFEAAFGELVACYTAEDGAYSVAATQSVDPLVERSCIDAAFAGEHVFATAVTPEGQQVRLYLALLPPGGSPLQEIPGVSFAVPLRQTPSSTVPAAVLVIGRPMDIVTSALSTLGIVLLIAVPLTLLVSAAGGLFLVGRAFQPVDRMIGTAQSIEESDLSLRVAAGSDDELGRLAHTLNAMLDRLQAAFTRQREFTDDASHELRSPLSVIEAEATLALRRERSAAEYRDALAVIAEEAAGMNRLIDQLLTLARADAGEDALRREPVPLAAMAQETVSAMQPIAEENDIRLEARAVGDGRVLGDSVQLRRVLTNLVENALRHTPAGGRIDVTVTAGDDAVTLTVSDTGPGIPADALPHIFERFYRVDAARARAAGGTGLGLAICRAIVAAHGGTISAVSPPGHGATFTVSLPRLH
jgi:heavy metal sensor kinase